MNEKPPRLIHLCVIKLHNELINEANSVDIFLRSSSGSSELRQVFVGRLQGGSLGWVRAGAGSAGALGE